MLLFCSCFCWQQLLEKYVSEFFSRECVLTTNNTTYVIQVKFRYPQLQTQKFVGGVSLQKHCKETPTVRAISLAPSIVHPEGAVWLHKGQPWRVPRESAPNMLHQAGILFSSGREKPRLPVFFRSRRTRSFNLALLWAHGVLRGCQSPSAPLVVYTPIR